MFGTQDLTLFIISGLLLNIAPGPDSLLIMARSASQGFRAGSAAALGVGSGTLVHVLAAALGLSALMAASSWAFGLVKLLGAAYLVYIGLNLLLRRAAAEGPREAAATLPPQQSLRSIYLQGLLTNVLNPKVALFFLAFVPQFIAADASSKPLAFVFLGLVFNLNGMLWCHFLAWSTAQASRRITASPRVVSWLNRAIGAVFLGFGLRLALAQR
ncbi:MAG: LysE family translocator [Paucibacter sp.]|nr:LysE family translocator [Roseateles sp.]